jgi:hypothetical protein
MIAKLIEEDAFLLSFAFATNEFELSLVTHQAGGAKNKRWTEKSCIRLRKREAARNSGPGRPARLRRALNTAQWPAGGLSKLMP